MPVGDLAYFLIMRPFNLCVAAEIGTFHSHQAVLSKHLLEVMYLFNLKIKVLDKELFPSGKVYHDEKPYINKMLVHEVTPYVFHMCWTTNKEDKIVYFRNINMWYVNTDSTCLNGPSMLEAFVVQNIVKSCCNPQLYWNKWKALNP